MTVSDSKAGKATEPEVVEKKEVSPEPLNSVCELKDSPAQDKKPDLRPMSTTDMASLSQSQTIDLSGKCKKSEDSSKKPEEAAGKKAGEGGKPLPEKATGAQVKLDAQAQPQDKGKPVSSAEAPDSPLSRAASRTLKSIELLLPPLPEKTAMETPESMGDVPPEALSMEDEKKLRALFLSASEADLKEIKRLDQTGVLAGIRFDPRISQSTKDALDLLSNSPADKRGDAELEKLAKIALKHGNLELFKESMAEMSRGKRTEFSDAELLKAFPGKDSKNFRLAKQYLELGRANPFEHLKENLGRFIDNREGAKLALSKLKKEDLELYQRGKKLATGSSAVTVDHDKMTKEEKDLFELGEKLARGKKPDRVLTPAEENKALNAYKDVEASILFRSLRDKDYWSPTTIPELNALADYPEGKLASNLADLRGFWAPPVREVAKVIRDTLITGNEPSKEMQFYKNNPDKMENISTMLDQLRLSQNDAMALKRYARFLVDGSLSIAEKALHRQPIIKAISDNDSLLFKRDSEFVVSAIQNMTSEEIERYKNPKTSADRKFREDLRNIAGADSSKWVSQTMDADHIKSAQETKDRIFQSEIMLRLLDKIDQGNKPEPDIVTKLQLNSWQSSKLSHAERLRMVVEALSDPNLREKLQSTANAQDQDFAKAFHKAARLALFTMRLNPLADPDAEYNNIVVPMIKTGVPPLKAMVEAGSGYFSLDAKVFEDIATAPKETREALIADGAKTVLAGWSRELQDLAVTVAKAGKLSDADKVWLGLNSKLSGSELIMKTLEKVGETPDGAAKFKAEFAKFKADADFDAKLKEKLSPIELARAKFILAENLSEREKYLEALDLMHSAIKGWGSRATEDLFGSATRGQAISAMDDYTAEVAKASRQLDATLADPKVRQAIWKAVENHVNTRTELMMYGGDASAMATPLAGAAFVAYVLGAEVTVPVTVALIMAGALSRMGVREGALRDFNDKRTKNLIIDTVTSTIISATSFAGPGLIVKFGGIGREPALAAAREVPTILAAVDSQAGRFMVSGATEILATESQAIVTQAILTAGKSFNEKMIRATAEKVIALEGFAAPAERAAAVNHMAYAIKTSLQQKYNLAEMSALMRYGKAGGADLGAGFFAGGTASTVDDLLHGKELGLHNLMAAMQAALFSGVLGSSFRGIGQYRASRQGLEKGLEGKRISDNIHEYQANSSAQNAASEVKVIPTDNAIEIRLKQGEPLRRFEFGSNPKSSDTMTPKKIIVGQGADKFEIVPDAQDGRLWYIMREGKVPQKLQAEISVNTKTGAYEVNHVTDHTADWYSRAFADGSPALPFTRKVTYHADGRVTYEGPKQNNFYPVEGSVFWKESRNGEFWQAPDGQKTWITGDDRIFRETFGGVWQAEDGVFVDGRKDVIKIREVKAEKLDEDLRWINEDDLAFVDRSNPNSPVLKAGADLSKLRESKAGEYYKIHTGRNDFFILKNGKLEAVDYYLAAAPKFEKSYRASGRDGYFVKTENMTVRQLKPGETREFDTDTGKHVFNEKDYVVIENGKETRGITEAEYKRLMFVDAPSKQGGLQLPPVEGTTSFDSTTGIARAKWARRDEAGKVISSNGVPEEGYIIWRNKEKTIEVVGGSEPRIYQIADVEANGYRFYWSDGSAEYVNPQGLRFTRKSGEETWHGEDGSRLIEARKDAPLTTLSKYDPVDHINKKDASVTRSIGLGLADEARFRPAEPVNARTGSDTAAPEIGTPSKQYFPDTDTLVVNEGNVQYVQTPEGRYRFEAGQPTWFLDRQNLLWSTSDTISVNNGVLQFPGKTQFNNPEGYTYTRNGNGQFWDFGSSGSKWIDTSGKYWFIQQGDTVAGTPKSMPRTWTGEDGSLYTEGSWQFTPRSRHDPRRAVQGLSVLGALGVMSRGANAEELGPGKQGQDALDPNTEALLSKLSPRELQELREMVQLWRQYAKAAGSEVLRSAKNGLYFASGAVPAVVAQDQLKQLLKEAKERSASHLRPDLSDSPQEAPKKPAEQEPAPKPAVEPLPQGKLTEADLIKRLAALPESNYPRLKGEEKARAGFVQQTLMENLELYHSLDLKSLQGKTEAELKSNYETLLKQSRLELQRSLKIEQTIGVFGPASLAAYNEFMSWSQKRMGPALRRQIQEWQANAPPDQLRSLIDEASGKAMSPQLYMAKLLAGELKEENLLKDDVRRLSQDDVSKLESTFYGLAEMQRLVMFKQMQNREMSMKQLIKDRGMPAEWLRKEGEALPQYLERVEKFVQLSAAVTSTIDRSYDLWKRSASPNFEFTLPPGAAIKLKGSSLKINADNLKDPEVQKLLKKGTLEIIDPGLRGDMRWDHPPGAMQRTIDWVVASKERTDKMEPVLEEIRKNPEKVIMYQDKPIVGQAVKLDANNKFVGLVSSDAKPEKPGEVITTAAGLLSLNYTSEKISTGPNAGSYRVVQTIQAFTTPALAYLDTRALGMEAVGDATVVSEKIYKPDDLIPVMNGQTVSYIKASELSTHKLLEQASYWGHKGMAAAFDMTIGASVAVTATGLRAVRAMSAVEIAAGSRAAAIKTIDWKASDSAWQLASLLARGTAVSTAPLNSTGGMTLRYNDLPVGEWINHGRGLFYMGEMAFGLARGGYLGYQKWQLGKEAFEAKEAARMAAGNLSSTEKLHKTVKDELPELMKALHQIDRANIVLQGPMAFSLGAEFYHKAAGAKGDSIAAAADEKEKGALGTFERLQKESRPESKLNPVAQTESFKQSASYLLKSINLHADAQKKESVAKLLTDFDEALREPGKKETLEKVKNQLLSNIVFSAGEWKQLEMAHPKFEEKDFRLTSKDMLALLDPQLSLGYPKPVRDLAENFLKQKDADITAISRFALLELNRRAGGALELQLDLPAYKKTVDMQTPGVSRATRMAIEVAARSETLKLDSDILSKQILYESLQKPQSAEGLLAAHELFASGKISAAQLGALYQDVLDNPKASLDAKTQALLGVGGSGLAWMIESMRAPKDDDSAMKFAQLRMGEKDFLQALERFAASKEQPEELRAVAAAQIHALKQSKASPADAESKTASETGVSFRAKALLEVNKEFLALSSKYPKDSSQYFAAVRERLSKELLATPLSATDEEKSKQLIAAQSLLLLGNGDPKHEKAAFRAIVNSFSINNPELSRRVMLALNSDQLKRFDEIDKSGADLLRRHSLSLLSMQARGKQENLALATLEEVKRLYSDSTSDMKAELKNKLISFIDKGTSDKINSDYIAKMPALRARVIDNLADLGSPDAIDKIREHASQGDGFVKDGQTYRFFEPNAVVRLSALNALEKLNGKVEKSARLENYLPELLARETDPTVSAAMQIAASRLGLTKVDNPLEDNLEQTMAVLMMQSLNDKDAGSRGWTNDLSLTKTWLSTNFEALSSEGLNAAAAANAKGFLERWTSSSQRLQKEEGAVLLETMQRQFKELVEMAGGNEERSNLAKRALHAIMTGQIMIPGSKENPILLQGSSTLTISEAGSWAKKAAQGLAEIASQDTSSKDLTAMFLLDGLLEARNPEVTSEIIKGLKLVAKDQPLKVQNFVSHRLCEFLKMKTATEGASGELAAKLLDFAYDLKNQKVISELPEIRKNSPYAEVRAKADELLLSSLDPVASYLSLPVDRTLSPEALKLRLEESMGKGPEAKADALRNLEGQDLKASSETLMKFLRQEDDGIKLLAANLILNSSLAAEDGLLPEAAKQAAILAKAGDAFFADESKADQSRAVRKRAQDTLQLLKSRMSEGQALDLGTESGIRIQLIKSRDQVSILGSAKELERSAFLPPPLLQDAPSIAATRDWLHANYALLSAKGMTKFASSKAGGVITRLANYQDDIVKEERKSLTQAVQETFNKLLDDSLKSDERGKMARQALYAILTEKIPVPGTEANPLIVPGTYPIKIDSLDLPAKATEALAKVARQETAGSQNPATMFLLDSLLEARNPRTAESVLSELRKLMVERPEQLKAFASHRLSEYLDLKEMKDGISGKFVAQLLEISHDLKDASTAAKLPILRERSPYKEVRERARDLMVSDLDPLKTYTKQPIDASLSSSGKLKLLTDAAKAGTELTAEELRKLEGVNLQNLDNDTRDFLAGSLDSSDRAVQILAARIALSPGSDLALEHPLTQKAMRQMAALALTLPVNSTEQKVLDAALALRRRAMDTLNFINERLAGDSVFSIKQAKDSESRYELLKTNGQLELREITKEQPSAYAYADGRSLKIRADNGKLLVNRNGIEYQPGPVKGLWIEKETGLLKQTPPDDFFMQDMGLVWRATDSKK